MGKDDVRPGDVLEDDIICVIVRVISVKESGLCLVETTDSGHRYWVSARSLSAVEE